MTIGRIASVWRYPVKSMAGEALDEGYLTFAGVYGDRVHAFHNPAAGDRFPYLTARNQERMIAYRARFVDPAAAARPVNLAAAEGGIGVTPLFADRAGFAVEVTSPDGRTWAIDDPGLLADLKAGLPTDDPVTVIHSPRALTDCRPLSLFSNATVRHVARAVDMAPDARRYRANLYADFADDAAFAENALVGHRLRIGDKAEVLVLGRDRRCKMITLDPDTGAAEPRLLRWIAREQGGMAGLYCAVLVEGRVRPGDAIAVVG
ncbi:molybdenum cofactor biosynthesis protein [Allostella vacuolata]|nr:molybdenum cofactor biosynthesis protein [Stella vacuolata]